MLAAHLPSLSNTQLTSQRRALIGALTWMTVLDASSEMSMSSPLLCICSKDTPVPMASRTAPVAITDTAAQECPERTSVSAPRSATLHNNLYHPPNGCLPSQATLQEQHLVQQLLVMMPRGTLKPCPAT